MKSSQRIRPSPRGVRGFTLVEIMIVIFILGVLMNMAAPAFIGARDNAQSKSCVANLKKFQGAKEQFALENNLPENSNKKIKWSQISGYLRYPNANPATGPTCPTQGSAYTYGKISQNPICTYGGPAGNPSLAHALK